MTPKYFVTLSEAYQGGHRVRSFRDKAPLGSFTRSVGTACAINQLIIIIKLSHGVLQNERLDLVMEHSCACC